MRIRFKTILFVIFLLIVGCILICIGYTNYIKVSNDTVVVADDAITINYLNGFEFTNTKTKIDFSVTNSSSEKTYYYIQVSNLKGNVNNVKYKITSKTSDISLEGDLKSDILATGIAIDGNKTDTYELEILKNGNDSTFYGKLVVHIKNEESITIGEEILANNEIKDKPLSSVGESATEDEGLIKSSDKLGVAYYFRGSVVNNYMSFAGYTWRIVKINGDGSVKLVLDDITDILNKYYDDDYFFKGSNIKNALEEWYTSNLDSYSDYIANYRFCNDYVYNDNSSSYEAYNRIITDKIPNYICLGEEVLTKIALLTADEAMLAGASTSKNESFYLHNEEIKTDYYTMTSAKKNDYYFPFIIGSDGTIKYETNGTLLRGVRPVINIIKNVSVTGTGTIDNPYVIKTN